MDNLKASFKIFFEESIKYSKSAIEIQMGRIIIFGYYPSIQKFAVHAESHDSQQFDSFEEAYKQFVKIWKPKQNE